MQTKDVNLGNSFLELEQYGRIVSTFKNGIKDMWKWTQGVDNSIKNG